MNSLWNQLKLIVFLLGFFFTSVTIAQNVKSNENSSAKLTKITLLLDWKPNTNHTGFFVAKNKGYFKDVGLDVTIVNPSPTSGTTLVGTGKSDFGISYANNLIHAREAGIPVVAIASIAQPDSSCFIWRQNSGIKSVKDFEGKRYAGWGSLEEAATLKFIMEQNGADFSKLKIVTVGVADFLQTTEKNAQITWEYKAWGMLEPQMHGVKIGSYCPSEHFKELQKPSPLLITNETLLKNNRLLVKKFAQASQKGFDYAIANPVDAAKILVAEVPGLDEKFVIRSQEIISPMYTAKAPYWGYISPAQFASYENWMFEQKLIKQKLDLNNFIVDILLPE